MSDPASDQQPPAIVLTPPEAVPVVQPRQVEGGGPVALSADEHAQLDERVAGFVSDITSAPIDGDAFKTRVDAILNMGNREVEESANISSRLLQRPVNAMAQGPNGQNSAISKGLVDLRNTCEKLDPKNRDLLAPSRLLGIIPFGNRLKTYFQSYQSAQSHLNSIMNSLLSGKDELLRDNASIEQERAEMWGLMGSSSGIFIFVKRSMPKYPRKYPRLKQTTRSAPNASKRTCCSTRGKR